MDLPVDKWKSYVDQKWALLQPYKKAVFSQTKSLKDIFLQCCSLIQPEDEALLERLSRDYSVEKDPDSALFFKEEGNRKFQRKNYRSAAMLYSKGVAHARPNTQEMSVCYANRSAALFYLGQYEVCLEDIKRAQGHGYPVNLQPKILSRKAECLLALGRVQEATQAVEELEGHLTASRNHPALQKSLSHLKVRVREKEGGQDVPTTGLTRTSTGLEFREENEQIPQASSHVLLRADVSRGRHLIAKEDILPGELLVKEEAFVSVLSPGEELGLQDDLETKWNLRITHGDRHCHNCLKPVLSSVPCSGCSYAKYCNQECLQQAWECYHKIECPLGGILLTLGVFCHVALRTVLVAGFEDVSRSVKWFPDQVTNRELWAPEGRSLDETPNSKLELGETERKSEAGDIPIPGCDVNGKYQNTYNAVFNLLPHSESHSPGHKFLCGFSIAALCKKLGWADPQPAASDRQSSSQKETTDAELSPELRVWGAAMLRHVLQLQCNAQALTTIQETASEGHVIASSRQVRLATGLFPVISLLNHSCSPNTSVSFSGRVAIVQATQPISRGQEILHCYGPHRCRMEVGERRQKLKAQYFFDCRCQACLEEEESKANTTPKWAAFRCPSCRSLMRGEDVLHCCSRACTVSVSRDHLGRQLQDLQLRVRRGLKLLEGDKPDQAVQLLLECRQDAESFLSAEHSVRGEIEDHLAQAYASQGQWQKAAVHLRSSLQAVEGRHGPASVEMGHELFKLAQVLFNGLAVTEALDAIQRAEEVLAVHYGPWNDQIQELQEMKSCLMELPPITTRLAV
ncbi:SET and MYND domain-containing protein 4 [Tachyglossus aculeatus]|uniref:SET and MYND domain-containing protein 4 n=1 Tax=Tachyglossus aculeatus TaxID=9261 RepID=UPI0018F2E915|nr:SET and MYND domain-containing protein 4 [Tachyglossus aculeatus]